MVWIYPLFIYIRVEIWRGESFESSFLSLLKWRERVENVVSRVLSIIRFDSIFVIFNTKCLEI